MVLDALKLFAGCGTKRNYRVPMHQSTEQEAVAAADENVYHQLCESRCSLLTILTLGLYLCRPRQLASRVWVTQTAIEQEALHCNENGNCHFECFTALFWFFNASLKIPTWKVEKIVKGSLTARKILGSFSLRFLQELQGKTLSWADCCLLTSH